MKYRRLGKTNLSVSVIGLGTWQYGGEWGIDFTQQDVDAIFERAREVGINLIDTAECYGDHLSESLVGNAIARDRSKWIVATKFGHHFHSFNSRTQTYDPDDVRGQLEASLKALKTDHVDLYQFHSGKNSEFETEGLWEMLHDQVQAGKIRHLGLSISPNTNIWQTERATDKRCRTIQVIYNRLDRAAEELVLPACHAQDLGVLARVPLASGFLSGKYKPGAQFAENDFRSTKQRDENDEKLRRAQKIQETEVPKDVDMAQWALAWCLKHDAVTAVIPGCKNVGQVTSNAGAADLDMVDTHHPLAVTL